MLGEEELDLRAPATYYWVGVPGSQCAGDVLQSLESCAPAGVTNAKSTVRNKTRRVTPRSRCSSTGGRRGGRLRALIAAADPLLGSPHPQGTRPQQVPPHRRQGLRRSRPPHGAHPVRNKSFRGRPSERALQLPRDPYPDSQARPRPPILAAAWCSSACGMITLEDAPCWSASQCCSTERLLQRGLTSVFVLQS